MNKELKKIIYFDENSATDLVYVKFDGKVLETHTNKKTNYIMSSFFFKKKQKIFLRNLFKFLHNKIGNLII